MSIPGIPIPISLQPINRPPASRADSHTHLAVRLGPLTIKMKTIKELLVEKELELAKVGRELEALRLVAPLLHGKENAVDKNDASLLLAATQELGPNDETVVDRTPVVASRWIRLQESTTRFFAMTLTRAEFWADSKRGATASKRQSP
jgi:hypothetical protein